jgi:prepilin-type N-terminal cleavage/methylation domain-containing protein/prepilin-type processing-associated H-X9-DG protein
MKKSNKGAFTLIELLVVIAIISILAAILFPVFASARAKAREMVCLSNMKQLGLATQQYVQDNDGKLFYQQSIDYSRSGVTVTANSAAGMPTCWWNLLMPYAASDAIFDCPEDPGPSPVDSTSGSACAVTNQSCYYTSENSTSGAIIPRSYIACSTPESLQQGQIPDESQTIVITEKWGGNVTKCSASTPGLTSSFNSSWFAPFGGDVNIVPGSNGETFKVANRHNRMLNCVFFDGHAKATKPEDILGSKVLSGCQLLHDQPFNSKAADAPTVSSPTSYPWLSNVCTNWTEAEYEQQ